MKTGSPTKSIKFSGEIKSKNCAKLDWSDEENKAIWEFFTNNIRAQKIPSKNQCELFQDEYNCSKYRSWVSVKSKVRNLIVLSRHEKVNFRYNKENSNNVIISKNK